MPFASDISREDFRQVFRDSLVDMFRDNIPLFARNLREECVNCAFLFILKDKLARFEKLKKLHYDLEYDKRGHDPKFMNGLARRPDIVIHRRGNHRKNFLFLEAKKRRLVKDDKEKVIQALGEGYYYRFTATLLYNPHKTACHFRIFEAGEEFEDVHPETVEHPVFCE